MKNKNQDGVLVFIKNTWAKTYVKIIILITIVSLIADSVLAFNHYQLIQSVDTSYDQAQTLLKK